MRAKPDLHDSALLSHAAFWDGGGTLVYNLAHATPAMHRFAPDTKPPASAAFACRGR